MLIKLNDLNEQHFGVIGTADCETYNEAVRILRSARV